MDSPSTVYLVDGSGYIFRAFYAVARLTNREGFPTNAIYGFTRMLLKLLSQAASNRVVVVFDAGRQTFRTELYPQYKANRSECPEELVPQFPYFRTICRALGLKILELPRYEADDVIGTLTRRLTECGDTVVVVSGDKDLMQLVTDQVTVWDTLKDKRFGRADVREKFGVNAEQVVELLGLMGDDSDNVPGLQGVGPKTAAQLIEKYGSVEGVISNVNELRNDATIKNRKKIADQIELDPEHLRLSRKLVQIDLHSPVEIAVGDKSVSVESLGEAELSAALEREDIARDELRQLFERFEFDSLLKEFNLNQAAPQTETTNSCHSVLSERFDSFVSKLLGEQEVAFDLETTSLDPRDCEVVGASFCWSENESWYVPISHRVSSDGALPGFSERVGGQVEWKRFKEALAPFFTNSKVKKIGQNLKYDLSVLTEQGVLVAGPFFDTMVAAYLVAPDRASFNLTVLARDYLGLGTIEYEDVVGDSPNFSFVPIEMATRYACQDARYAWLLKGVLEPKLSEFALQGLFDSVEMPLLPVLAQMEHNGVRIDIAHLEKMSHEFGDKLDHLRLDLFELAGGAFNMNSPKQLSEILFDRLNLPTKGLKKTKTGISTDSSVLEKLQNLHPLPAKILEYRMLFKLKNTYIDVLPTMVSHRTGRLHSKFNQTGTGTGRLSSSEPNLQNIPVQTTEGRRIRATFIAEPGNCLISADYSQIELRLLAHLSGDQNLIRAFHEGLDIHAQTAREILGVAPGAEIDADARRLGKTINFGLMYGMSAFRLGADLGIPVHVAQQYMDQYFRNFPAVKGYFATLEQDAVEKGYVTTLFGRRRVIADLNTAGRDRGFMVRAAMNAPLQGSAADIIKLAMVRIAQRIEQERLSLKMILQIHDELLFECPAEVADQMTPIVVSEMERVLELKVPLKVDVGVGQNWEEVHG